MAMKTAAGMEVLTEIDSNRLDSLRGMPRELIKPEDADGFGRAIADIPACREWASRCVEYGKQYLMYRGQEAYIRDTANGYYFERPDGRKHRKIERLFNAIDAELERWPLN